MAGTAGPTYALRASARQARARQSQMRRKLHCRGMEVRCSAGPSHGRRARGRGMPRVRWHGWLLSSTG